MKYLVRYGVIPEVARCDSSGEFARGAEVVLETHRGLQVGTILDVPRPPAEPRRGFSMPGGEAPAAAEPESAFKVLREAADADRRRLSELRVEAQAEFPKWEQRIRDWKLDLQLIDLEWTLDRSKVILYVLNERGPECTKLAIQAAAAGLGITEVQPVSREGLVSQPTETGGGCGSCSRHN